MARTQEALYRDLDLDLDLSWSEQALPERERTKHVHRLHPYLGKFIPQLEPYWCYKHRRTCRPVETARRFLAASKKR